VLVRVGVRASLTIFALFLAACDGGTPADAGVDAGDAGGRRDAGHDAGPLCTTECAGNDTCCFEPGGAEVCTSLRTDPRHCGLCEVDCIATDRGDGCNAMQCTCGDSLIGCLGTRNSFCCPPRAGGGSRYCTDLDRTPTDCGACDVQCDARVADRCSGGVCTCGEARSACPGGMRCCYSSVVDVGCVDTASDEFHCGRCGNLCELGEQCCGGTCCPTDRCVAGACRAPDAGAPDAGPFDAGPFDAGPFDAGPFDAGP
jgi:hypothetical protein